MIKTGHGGAVTRTQVDTTKLQRPPTMKPVKITLFVCTDTEADTMNTIMEGGSSLCLYVPPVSEADTRVRRRGMYQAVQSLCRDVVAYRGDGILPVFCIFTTGDTEESTASQALRREAVHYATRAQMRLERVGLHVSLVNTAVHQPCP
jgi:hypothetical protein